jgi:hypothetical protein
MAAPSIVYLVSEGEVHRLIPACPANHAFLKKWRTKTVYMTISYKGTA